MVNKWLTPARPPAERPYPLPARGHQARRRRSARLARRSRPGAVTRLRPPAFENLSASSSCAFLLFSKSVLSALFVTISSQWVGPGSLSVCPGAIAIRPQGEAVTGEPVWLMRRTSGLSCLEQKLAASRSSLAKPSRSILNFRRRRIKRRCRRRPSSTDLPAPSLARRRLRPRSAQIRRNGTSAGRQRSRLPPRRSCQLQRAARPPARRARRFSSPPPTHRQPETSRPRPMSRPPMSASSPRPIVFLRISPPS